MQAATLILVACFGPKPVAAKRGCQASLADWQPREALEKKLAAEGWTVSSTRLDDGCYKARATNDRGERLHAIRPGKH
ncbi:PepSY domain-containing protein [Methylocapsa palsarum]|uniref:Peptidase propeptide and YPEB domain-containing protein n=1 Tax=Methylocapsa palsarum TaxID=1612308 RepID=A0A1I4CIV6_9HYPH|nr:PepSY domain-containing protein [Methylocapsa palsarum]SFK81168.1 Peptidase propeptide and YPEB domain-containing protein [Methylocapsa palsarum]